MREYVITLHNFDDLDEFYQDMETSGGNLFIPNREVDITHRRPVSRNTNYMLTEEEAQQISQDPRVLAVGLTMEEQGIKLVPLVDTTLILTNMVNETITPTWTEGGAPPVVWDKQNLYYTNASQKNWGLLRCVEGVQRLGWGKDSATTYVYNAIINVTASGKNVDLVIVDGHINPDHPEYAVNVDGTGGSRVNQFNWFSLNPQVTGASSSTYVYTPYIGGTVTGDNDHGAHVAGTAGGNTQGWAHDANIYNINPYTSNTYFLDYIKVWHTNKSINPVTGIKNPTITNHSYGSWASFSVVEITSVRYNGTVYTGSFTSNQLTNWGIYNSGGFTNTLQRNVSLEADFYDLMQAGIIVVGAAGNSSHKIALYSDIASNEYNNYYVVLITNVYYTVYYNKGSTSAAPGVICVGAISAGKDEAKASFSNCGPRVDIYAPGELIISSVHSTALPDPRNSNFYLYKLSGTSMASPQVAGVLACFLETNPKASQADALKYITSTAKINQIFSFNLGPSDSTDLQGSPNRYLYFYKQRLDDGFVGPKVNLGVRPSTGQTWPRTNIFRYGS